MKSVLIAGLLYVIAAPAFAQDNVIAQLQSIEDRLKRIEAITNAQIVGFYYGGALECGPQIPEAKLTELMQGTQGNPEVFAAFSQGFATAAMQNAFNVSSKEAFCNNLEVFRAENGL